MRQMVFLGVATWLLFCGAVVVGLVAVPAPAWPQGQCAPVNLMERALQERHGEQLFVIGKAQSEIMRLYANPSTRTWTALSVNAQGIACIIRSGDSFDMARPPPGGKAS